MQDETHIWTYIPVADFDVPSPPASDAARGGVLRLWKSLQRLFHQPKKRAESEEPQRHRPSVELLRSMSPDPDWKQAAIHLADTLGDEWFEKQQPTRLIYAFVGAPGCNIAGVLQALAQQRKLSVLAAPSPDLLLEASKSNMSALHAVDETTGEILVIPSLERWYLRHEDGLTMMRELLERLITVRKRVLIGCDSWAWAFLQHAVGIENILGGPQTLAPFDAKRLDAWFRATFDFQRHELRQIGNDEPVFPEVPNADKENTKQPQRESSTLISSLAAKARGNPGVALALWRDSLRTRDTDTDASATPPSSAPSVLWVESPTELAPPQLPVNIDRIHRFVLHSVLLHGGLSLSSLVLLLPFSRDEIQRRVSVLRRAAILEEQDDKLRVTLTAYPLVRHDLQSEGFLTDAF